jgi:perosamine synthetase
VSSPARAPDNSRRIPVADPALVGREREYVLDCLDSTWISSSGEYIGRFEHAFAEFCGVQHAIACCNGTVALHLALVAHGVGPGDEVIVPTLTYVATANCVRYCGGEPVFVDAEPDTWNLDPEQVERAVTSRTKGIVAVHLYGHPARMDDLNAIAGAHGLFVLEDAAEAHGARYKDRRVGGIGDSAIFSFYGNKIITTGEGGMLVTDDDELAAHARQLRGQGQDPARRYWFPVVGFNYRMTNVAAAIGVAQMERIDWHVARRREVAAWYRERLAGLTSVTFSPESPWAENAYWMSCVVLGDEVAATRDEMAARLDQAGVETRPFFYPLHTLPPYSGSGPFPVAERLGARGLNLPSSALLTEDDVAYVCGVLADAVGR